MADLPFTHKIVQNCPKFRNEVDIRLTMNKEQRWYGSLLSLLADSGVDPDATFIVEGSGCAKTMGTGGLSLHQIAGYNQGCSGAPGSSK